MGDYRVDFLLTLRADSLFVRSSFNLYEFPSGKKVEKPRNIDFEKKLVIECDGHEYHERTKEQARGDKQRDRYLQRFGFPVYRYTGSEVWENVFKGA